MFPLLRADTRAYLRRIKFAIHESVAKRITSIQVTMGYFSRFWVNIILKSQFQHKRFTRFGRYIYIDGFHIPFPILEDYQLRRDYVFFLKRKNNLSFFTEIRGFAEAINTIYLNLSFIQEVSTSYDLLNWNLKKDQSGKKLFFCLSITSLLQSFCTLGWFTVILIFLGLIIRD